MTRNITEAIIRDETNSIRFEDFCREVCERHDGIRMIPTSKSYDQGRDAKSLDPRHGAFVCATLQKKDLEGKIDADTRHLAWNPRYRAITDKKNRGEWIERFSVYLDGQYSARAYHKAVELRTHTSRNRKIRALAQEMLGKSVADVVPLPAFPSEQVREYIRASKAASTLRGY
jgi:hypothetical protein